MEENYKGIRITFNGLEYSVPGMSMKSEYPSKIKKMIDKHLGNLKVFVIDEDLTDELGQGEIQFSEMEALKFGDKIMLTDNSPDFNLYDVFYVNDKNKSILTKIEKLRRKLHETHSEIINETKKLVSLKDSIKES